jgi:hypothetical protein
MQRRRFGNGSSAKKAPLIEECTARFCAAGKALVRQGKATLSLK